MKNGRLYVDFNEMIEDDLVLLSQNDFIINSEGIRIDLYEGMIVDIYMNDIDDEDKIDNLVATGIAVPNNTNISWTQAASWLCRIDKNGIRHESEILNKV